MSTIQERRKEMYQKSIRWAKDAIAYAQSLLNDQNESSLYYSAIEKQRKDPLVNQNSNAMVVEIGGQFTVILSQNRDEVERVDSFMSVFKKNLAHAYAKHYLNLWKCCFRFQRNKELKGLVRDDVFHINQVM